jgi:effector-binding domain-containing protein
MSKFLSLALGLALLVSVSVGLQQTSMAKTETAPYQSVQQEGNIEIRHYPTLLVAETETTGSTRDEAANAAFRRLFGYITGKNSPKANLAMTTPVFQQKSEAKTQTQGVKLAMTTPVTEESLGSQRWRMRFVMPEGFQLDTLPQPENEKITLLELPAHKALVIRFSGSSNDEALSKNRNKLEAYAKEKGFILSGEPIAAFYNGPFTLPFLRRNEVMWHLAD